MEKIVKKYIDGMGYIEFGRFYNKKNKKINSMNESPIIKSSMVKEISLKELQKLLDNNYIFNLIEHREKINIYKTKAQNLLSKYRFDIFIEYYYVKAYMKNENVEEATRIYLSHIKAFNNFHEPDKRKNNEIDFIESFNKLINDVKDLGSIDKTIVPVSTTGIPVDGAHRIAIALYFDLEINYAVFDLLDGKYDKEFFIQRGMPFEYIKKVDKLLRDIMITKDEDLA